MSSRYVDYAKRGGKEGYEIEHIWADHPERHEDEFAHSSEFAEYRNRIGTCYFCRRNSTLATAICATSRNLVHYDSQNLLARSLSDAGFTAVTVDNLPGSS
jgi:hypothetical protein